MPTRSPGDGTDAGRKPVRRSASSTVDIELPSIEHVNVRPDAIDVTVLVPRGVRTTAAAARSILETMPDLGEHICVSAGHERFGEEIVGTGAAHLIEHVAIEFMVQTAAACDAGLPPGIAVDGGGARGGRERSARTFTGHTSHLPSLPGDDPDVEAFRVSITYDNDLVAIAAMRHACAIVGWTLSADADAKRSPAPPLPQFDGILKELLALHRC